MPQFWDHNRGNHRAFSSALGMPPARLFSAQFVINPGGREPIRHKAVAFESPKTIASVDLVKPGIEPKEPARSIHFGVQFWWSVCQSD